MELGSGTLPSTIPQIESQIAHKFGMAVFDVDSSTQSSNIFCDIIAEYDGSHGGFSRTRFAHQQDLLLALPSIHGETFR